MAGLKSEILGNVERTISVSQAANALGKCPETVRRYCPEYGIGWQTKKNGEWRVSVPRLRMLYNGNMEALEACRRGEYENPIVVKYFKDA